MCTVLLRIVPDAAWPLQLAFVRDEDRDRTTDPFGAWWPDRPRLHGGHDRRAGGTWLALDAGDAPAVALLTDIYDPAASLPDPTRSPTRGTLPLLAAERGALFDLEADAPGGVPSYQPFHLVNAFHDADEWVVEHWSWDGSALEHRHLHSGDYVVASRALTLPGETARRARIVHRLTTLDEDSPSDGWTQWKAMLDSRDVGPDDLDQLAVHSVAARPGFGTVGATLVALRPDGFLVETNDEPSLDPAAWRHAKVVAGRV